MLVPLVFALASCSTPDTGAVEPVDSGDTSDSAIDSSPVWAQHRIESSSTLNGIYASGSGVYTVGTGGFAWVGGTDGWTFKDIDVNGANLTDLWGQGQNSATILAASTTVGWVAQYSGTSGWTTGDLSDTNEIKGVGGSGPDALFAVGWGRAYSYNGTTWTYEALPDAAVKLNDVYAVGENAFAIGEDGACLQRASGGVWKECVSGVTVALNGISGSGKNDVWAVGAAGTVVHYDGTEWKVQEVPTAETLWAVFVPEEGSVVAVGSNGAAIRLMGGEWEVLPTGVDNILYAVHGVSANNIWASGNQGMTLQFKEVE